MYVTYDNGTTYSAAAAFSRLLSHKLYYIVYDNILYFIFNLALPVFVLMLLNIRMIIALKADLDAECAPAAGKQYHIRSHNRRHSIHHLPGAGAHQQGDVDRGA